MSIIIGENVSHSFGAQEVLKDMSFRVGESDRIGLVGPNGQGKTTLLRIIAGLLYSTLGQAHRGKGLRLGYLPQSPPSLDGGTIHDAMLEVFAELRRKEQELHDIAIQLEKSGNNSDLLKRYGQMQTEFEAAGGYDYNTRIEQVLTGLDFPQEMWEHPLAKLSGGQRTRVYLASLLLQDPDILLLDEPTNHLDLDSVEWLESWIKSYKGALIVVSHDRYFLDHVTQNTWEVAFGTLETYHGAYSDYARQRTERYNQRLSEWKTQRQYIEKTQEYIARFIAGQRSRQAKGRRTRLERFLRDEAIYRPKEHQTISVSLSAAGRTGDFVLRAEDLVVGYDAAKPLLKIERLVVEREQRVAIVGANGTGKTTLLRTLLGRIQPLAGTVRLGGNVKIGYLSQTHAELDPDRTAIDLVMAMKKNCTELEARNVLGSLLLSGDDAFKKISQLSGGQRSRVALARLMMQKINVLMLDEPTNHLDIPSTEIMQDVLDDFDGTIVFVSHDRYLVQNVATHIWAIDGTDIHCVPGSWEDYLTWRIECRARLEAQSRQKEKQTGQDSRTDHEQSRKQANLLRRLKRRHEELESEIDKVERELANLNQQITAASQTGDLAKIEKLGKDYQQKDIRLKQLWKEWEEVGTQLE